MPARLWNFARDYTQGNVGTANRILSVPVYKVKIAKGIQTSVVHNHDGSLFKEETTFPPSSMGGMNTLSCKVSSKN